MLRILSLLLLLIPIALPAAEPETEETPAESTTDASDMAAIEAEDPALAEEIRAAEAARAAAPPADSNEPFVPTIQISEDLSVSFPVDI